MAEIDDPPADPQGVAPPVPADPPPPRVPRTHINPEVIQLLKDLPFYGKLEKNKQLEAENSARTVAKLNHRLNQEAYPDDGSDLASLVTIEEGDLIQLLDDDLRAHYRPVMSIAVTKWVADTQKAIAEGEHPSLKRAFNVAVADVTKKTSAEEARLAKRRCMDGSLQMPRVIGVPATIIFPQTLFDTENCVSIPLPFFLNKNLRYIIDKAATLPTIKSNPLAGETKGISIIDVEKLSASLGREGSLTCSQWTEAAFQMYRFQQERDSEGPNGAFARWYSDHFNFFNTQLDRDEMYPSWKAVELELRQEFRSQPTNYDAAHYVARYELAKSESRILSRFESLGKSDRDRPTYSARGGGSNWKGPRPGNGVGPFPSGSQRNSLPPCCILCAQRGHSIFHHNNDTNPAKFDDGQPVWAKFSNRSLRAPDNREICIKYNIKGDRSECTHRKEERAHICSFCGKLHFAFSWSCRTRPADV